MSMFADAYKVAVARAHRMETRHAWLDSLDISDHEFDQCVRHIVAARLPLLDDSEQREVELAVALALDIGQRMGAEWKAREAL